ncbi:MAG: hypothetical protein NZ805_03965 [Armatimonadetes bacterium]|nr:hypothetical protein [Armatimonadota bacterium]
MSALASPPRAEIAFSIAALFATALNVPSSVMVVTQIESLRYEAKPIGKI